MAAPPLKRSLSTRFVKKLEKPRPLKISASQSKISSDQTSQLPLQDLMVLVESVRQHLLYKSFDENLASNITFVHAKLKVYGQQLETIYKDQLDRAFAIFRDGCLDDGLICTARLQLLELVELRANQWSNCDNTSIYYSAKMASSEIEPIVMTPKLDSITSPMPSSPMPPVLSPGEVLKNSEKFPKPTKIPGKNYCNHEVVIQNLDSEKVNPGAKERLVQITGPSEDNIMHTKQLMEKTMRHNESPVREGHDRHGRGIGGSSSSLNSRVSDESNHLSGSRRSILHSYSTNDASLGEYKFTVLSGNDTVKITGQNYETVRIVRLILEEYYNTWIQKNCIGDCYGNDEDVFKEPVADMSMLRLNSVDSAAINTVFSYHDVNPISQTDRRPVLGRTDSITSPKSQVKVSRKYSRAFLLERALSHHSRVMPPNWNQISLKFRSIVKKAGPKGVCKKSVYDCS